MAFVFPKLFPETIPDISRALLENRKPVFSYRWAQRGRRVTELLSWTPEMLYEAEETARRHRLPTTLDAMTKEVVGGKFCRRASNFGADAVPSAVALAHRAVRARLIYEFVVKLERLRAPTEGPYRRPLPVAVQPVGRQVGGKRPSTRDRDETLPKQVRESCAASQDVRYRPSRRDDDNGDGRPAADARRFVRR